MPATAAARRVAASPARRATASRPALKQRARPAQPRRKPTAALGSRTAAPSRGGARSRAGSSARHSRRRSQTPVSGFVPVVVGRTAGAVGGIADSGLVTGMTRGRAWIAVLGILLVGIVALNVWALSLNASSSKVAAQTDTLKRANSALQAQIAAELSNEQVQATAARLGLIVPEPGAIRYLDAGGDNAAIAAKRLAAGELTLGAEAPAPVAPTDAPAAPVTDPAAPADPATTAPGAAALDPAAPVEETAVEPAAPTPVATAPPAPTAGGVPTP